MRILFAGFQHETNTFAPDLADDAAFAHGGGFPGLCRGEEVVRALVPTANIPGAGFLQAEQAAADRRDHLGLAPDDPAFGFARRQIGDRQRAAVGPDHILHARPN